MLLVYGKVICNCFISGASLGYPFAQAKCNNAKVVVVLVPFPYVSLCLLLVLKGGFERTWMWLKHLEVEF